MKLRAPSPANREMGAFVRMLLNRVSNGQLSLGIDNPSSPSATIKNPDAHARTSSKPLSYSEMNDSSDSIKYGLPGEEEFQVLDALRPELDGFFASTGMSRDDWIVEVRFKCVVVTAQGEYSDEFSQRLNGFISERIPAGYGLHTCIESD